ncbi:hypothetical protein [Streptomyces sp. NPDC001435]|uniref:hypothetical protein n=1 Tax=unclassified Streptomyces TaxID=2593676 RepID=UPI00368298A5
MTSRSRPEEPEDTTTADTPQASARAHATENPDHPFGFYSRSLKDSVWDATPERSGHIGKQLAEKWSTLNNNTETPHTKHTEPNQEHEK